MLYNKLTDFDFHDSVINDICCAENTVNLCLSNVFFQKAPIDIRINVQIEENDFYIRYLEQYPCFHKIKLKGREILLKELHTFFLKGYHLEITELLFSTTSDLISFECTLFPYSRKRGVYKKIILNFNCKEQDFIISMK